MRAPVSARGRTDQYREEGTALRDPGVGGPPRPGGGVRFLGRVLDPQAGPVRTVVPFLHTEEAGWRAFRDREMRVVVHVRGVVAYGGWDRVLAKVAERWARLNAEERIPFQAMEANPTGEWEWLPGVGLMVGPSCLGPRTGLGVVVAEPVAHVGRGTFLGRYAGAVVRAASTDSCRCVQHDGGWVVDGDQGGDWTGICQHGERRPGTPTPVNCKLVYFPAEGKRVAARSELWTTRDLVPGEELFWAYWRDTQPRPDMASPPLVADQVHGTWE